MDILKELFGNGDDLQTNFLDSSLQTSITNENVKVYNSQGLDRQAKHEEILPYPLPLLPTDVHSRHYAACRQVRSASSVPVTDPGPINTHKDHVDIREVPSEMPMYLLAEDEGNEEEILRLLESTSPRSPDVIKTCENHPTISSKHCTNGSDRDSSLLVSGCRSSSVPPNFAHFRLEPSLSHSITCDNVLQQALQGEIEGKQQVKKKGNRLSKRDVSGTTGKCHGGGWPKGKSRKPQDEILPPKPPATGYAIFLSEKRLFVQQQCGTNSMPVISRRLGKMWSELTEDQKKFYYSRAKEDRVRYFSELRKYLADSYKGMNMEKADSLISESFTGECDDSVLVCRTCQLNFTSLYNKQSHFSGKLHLQSLLEHLHQLLKESNSKKLLQSKINTYCHPNGEQSAIPITLNMVADDCDRCRNGNASLRSKIEHDLETNAFLQQLYREAEYFRVSYDELLSSLRTKELLLTRNIQKLLKVLKNIQVSP